jgi:hypothetical protein
MLIAYAVVQLIFFSKSKTMGKAALGLQVVSSVNGEPIGFWSMLFREWFVKKASASIFMLGYIWVCIDERNRGWHDKILDTYVVDIKESEALNRPRKTSQETHAQAGIPNADIMRNQQPAKTAEKPEVNMPADEPQPLLTAVTEHDTE